MLHTNILDVAIGEIDVWAVRGLPKLNGKPWLGVMLVTLESSLRALALDWVKKRMSSTVRTGIPLIIVVDCSFIAAINRICFIPASWRYENCRHTLIPC